MIIERKNGVLEWGELDVAICAVMHDWNNAKLDIPVGYSFSMDEKALWFIATHSKPALLHPDAQPSAFVSGLWEYDVAEFFMRNPLNGHYLEFNLSPNSAWWAAEFSGPREMQEELPLLEVETFADLDANGSWLAAARLDLAMLKKRFGFSAETAMNTTFIIGSPEPQFVSVADLGGGELDFHRPDEFRKVEFVDEEKLRELMGG